MRYVSVCESHYSFIYIIYIQTEAEFRQAITNFAKYCIPSPEAMEALKYFKENQYKAAIDALTNFNVVNEKLAIEMKEREKLQEQYYWKLLSEK